MKGTISLFSFRSYLQLPKIVNNGKKVNIITLDLI